MLPKNCTRIDQNRIKINSRVPATIFANEQVPVEDSAVEELQELLTLEETVERMHRAAPELFQGDPSIERVSLSPDFHKGVGIPIGTSMLTKNFAVPQAVGNDINCGVRLHRTSLSHDEVRAKIDELEPRLRHIYFEGGRHIPFTQQERIQLLTNGIFGLVEAQESKDGIWRYFDRDQQYRDLERTRHNGGFDTQGKIFGLEDYVARTDVTRDSQIGSIGGNNHFCELQYVTKIHNGAAAHAWDLKVGQVVLMVHTGSVNVGHLCGSFYTSLIRDIYPKQLGYPKNGIFPLPNNHPSFKKFFSALHNAANFAFANRMILALMMHQALSEICGEHSFELVYDSPHNLAWEQADNTVLHRKGACPAGGIGEGCDPYFGEVVLVPGSMGSVSYVMEGCGNPEALGTASHGAGRQLSRGEAIRHSDLEFDKFLQEFRIVTPIDPNRHDVRNRPEIIAKYRESLKKEAPFAYKGIYPVVNTLHDAKVAKPVAELKPILTLKGL